ncbi:hypothetical protein LIER_38733 [Lithospermum erythrorhizon]|uniref:Uncharacterized protein n=1 Tax=Lithospermum erythrorhizon TaxID=34254 RepID=A0AAV3Q6I8_LITER
MNNLTNKQEVTPWRRNHGRERWGATTQHRPDKKGERLQKSKDLRRKTRDSKPPFRNKKVWQPKSQANGANVTLHITVEEGEVQPEDDIDATLGLEEHFKAIVDELKEINLGKTEDPCPTYVRALLTPEEEAKYYAYSRSLEMSSLGHILKCGTKPQGGLVSLSYQEGFATRQTGPTVTSS